MDVGRNNDALDQIRCITDAILWSGMLVLNYVIAWGIEEPRSNAGTPG